PPLKRALIDAMAKLEEEASFYDCYRELHRLRVPIIAVEGNNDYTAIEKGAYFWEKYFGPLYGVVQVRLLICALDSDMGRVYPDQLELGGRKQSRITMEFQRY
ncbi:MAG: hypothetical protein QI223_10240, partial [Candidatus Korarchaeota archaeon]|nr:hypothetical protein [Candidatus Korarchaeota archaeon]